MVVCHQTGKILEMGLFSLPPLEYETRAFFIDLGLDVQQAVRHTFARDTTRTTDPAHALQSFMPAPQLSASADPGTGFVGVWWQVEAAGRCYVAGIHAVNHALLSVTPLFLLCDTGDIDTEHVYPYQQRPRPPRYVAS